MKLSAEERAMLAGEYGQTTQKAMEILNALGTIYEAERMIPVTSVQISGVSYANLGEAGLQFLTEMADGGGQTQDVGATARAWVKEPSFPSTDHGRDGHR